MCVCIYCTVLAQRADRGLITTVFTSWTFGHQEACRISRGKIFSVALHGNTAGGSGVRNRASQYLDSYYLTVYKGGRVARRPIIHGPFLLFFAFPESRKRRPFSRVRCTDNTEVSASFVGKSLSSFTVSLEVEPFSVAFYPQVNFSLLFFPKTLFCIFYDLLYLLKKCGSRKWPTSFDLTFTATALGSRVNCCPIDYFNRFFILVTMSNRHETTLKVFPLFSYVLYLTDNN